MKMKGLIPLFLACAGLLACQSPTSIQWIEGEVSEGNRLAANSLVIQNPPKGDDWSIYFCQFRTPLTLADDSPARIDHLGGTLYRIVPTSNPDGGDMVIDYDARPLVNQCRAPEGFYLQKDGKTTPLKVKYSFLDCEKVTSFTYNKVDTSPFDMIPRLKSVTPLPGETAPDLTWETKYIEDPVQEDIRGICGTAVPRGFYRIRLDGNISVEAADEDGAYYASVTLDNLRRNAAGGNLPNAVIEDYPDLQYRGLMLDVSRNFTNKKGLLTLIDILAHYKVNRLHLHFGDDEGWRIAIDGLDELTSFGAFRAIPTIEESGGMVETEGLMPSYSGTGGKDDAQAPGNGFYSKEDFIEILRYAYERRILVVPEFDTPGHSRAAVKSMEKMAERTGSDTYLLSEKDDASSYVSVQDYTDNVMNVALPSTYTFIGKVFDSLLSMYKEAGVPLEAIHIGGDEVPRGAWMGSPSCLALMEEKGITTSGGLMDYYIGRVLDLAEERGIKIAGWQDITQHLAPQTMERLKKNLAFTNFWTVSEEGESLAYRLANNGVNVVLSNSSNNYFDLAYNYGKTERGHSWAGFVDERRSFSFLPYDYYKSVRWDDYLKKVDISQLSDGKESLTPEGRPHIVGVQGQLWSETIRSFDHVCYYLFPKAVGLFERGWNASPVWEGTTVSDDPLFTKDFDQFFSIITQKEYPYYDEKGISYHVN